MAQKPDSKEGKEIPFILEPKRKINLNLNPCAKDEILRPKDWTDQPYIGKGRDYPTYADLQEADRRFRESRITPILDLGKPYNNLNELKFPIIIHLKNINFREDNTPELDLKALEAEEEARQRRWRLTLEFLPDMVRAEREKRGLKLKPPIESSVIEYAEGLERYFRVIEDTLDRAGETIDPLLEPVL